MLILNPGRLDYHVDDQFTGAFPRYSGAISAVTGGPPEDINGVPASLDPDALRPVYDGSDLDQSPPVALRPFYEAAP